MAVVALLLRCLVAARAERRLAVVALLLRCLVAARAGRGLLHRALLLRRRIAARAQPGLAVLALLHGRVVAARADVAGCRRRSGIERARALQRPVAIAILRQRRGFGVATRRRETRGRQGALITARAPALVTRRHRRFGVAALQRGRAAHGRRAAALHGGYAAFGGHAAALHRRRVALGGREAALGRCHAAPGGAGGAIAGHGGRATRQGLRPGLGAVDHAHPRCHAARGIGLSARRRGSVQRACQRLPAVAFDGLDAFADRRHPRRGGGARNDRAFQHRGLRTLVDAARRSRDEAAFGRRHAEAADDVGVAPLPGIDIDATGHHRARTDEGVARHRGQRRTVVAPHVVGAGHRAATRIVVVDVGDAHVVDDRRVVHVDVGEVTVRAVVPRHVDITRAEREPADRATQRHARAPAVATHEGHHRRRIDRAHMARARAPAPTVADIDPAAVVERRETPWRIVDPGPAPRADPRPVTAAVRRPAHRDLRRVPHGAVVARGRPRTVFVKVVGADHVVGDVLTRYRTRVGTLARCHPVVEIVGARQVENLVVAQRTVVEAVGIAGPHAVAGIVLAVNVGVALEHRDHGRASVGGDVDAVQARHRGHECQRRRVDLVALAPRDAAHAQAQYAFAELELREIVIEVEQVERAAVVDAHGGATQLQFGARVAIGVQRIAGHQRTVQ